MILFSATENLDGTHIAVKVSEDNNLLTAEATVTKDDCTDESSCSITRSRDKLIGFENLKEGDVIAGAAGAAVTMLLLANQVPFEEANAAGMALAVKFRLEDLLINATSKGQSDA